MPRANPRKRGPAATNLRKLIVDAIPMDLKRAIGVGIGIYIAFIGLKSSGLIVSSEATSITLLRDRKSVV